VEDLAERRTVSIRMGWLWVEGTPMRLPLRALNLRQAAPNLCQPHPFALGFTLSNPQGHSLATFWVIVARSFNSRPIIPSMRARAEIHHPSPRLRGDLVARGRDSLRFSWNGTLARYPDRP